MDCIPKLKGGNIPDNEFEPTQLEIGIEVEKEHIDDIRISKQIAKAHLLEDKDYYRKLRMCGL